MFLLFGEVGAADEAYGYFVAEGGEELEQFGFGGLGLEVGVSRREAMGGMW